MHGLLCMTVILKQGLSLPSNSAAVEGPYMVASKSDFSCHVCYKGRGNAAGTCITIYGEFNYINCWDHIVRSKMVWA